MVTQSWLLQPKKAKMKAKDLYIPFHQDNVEPGKAELRIFNSRCDLRHIVKGILAAARLVPSSCASAPRNIRKAGISSYTYVCNS